MIDLFSTGAYLRCPGGNVENINDQKPVIKWAALNIGLDECVDKNPLVWARQRELYSNAGIEVFPWLHCRSTADIDFLMETGTQWRSLAIGFNVEDVEHDFRQKGITLADLAKRLEAWTKDIHMPTLPWVQNAQGWSALSRCVAALEIMADEQGGSFPSGKPDPEIVQQCIDHAFAEGLKKVTLMFKTKGYSKSDYGTSYGICHSLYTADDIPPLPSAWAAWGFVGHCVRPTGGTMPAPKPKPPLSEKKFPNTSPRYGPSHHDGPSVNSPTVQAIKRGMIRLGYLNQRLGTETNDFGQTLEDSLRDYQRHIGIQANGQYGRSTWQALRTATVPAEFLHAGEYAMDAKALSLVRADALVMCYPHPIGAMGEICQGLHPTDGLPGNWAMDFCAPGGTKVVAVERAVITKLSGHDPSEGAVSQAIGIFGWSIYYRTTGGFEYFSTHYGSRASLHLSQVVEVGQVVGTVGHWPGDPSRSHTHLGCSSTLGTAAAKKRITEISQAQRMVA